MIADFTLDCQHELAEEGYVVCGEEKAIRVCVCCGMTDDVIWRVWKCVCVRVT